MSCWLHDPNKQTFLVPGTKSVTYFSAYNYGVSVLNFLPSSIFIAGLQCEIVEKTSAKNQMTRVIG